MATATLTQEKQENVWLATFKRAAAGFGKHTVARLGAALAYYTFTSFFPLILVLIAILGFALNANLGFAVDARKTVFNTITSQVPGSGSEIVDTFADIEENSGGLGLVGLATGLWAASGIFGEVDGAFNNIFAIKTTTGGGIRKQLLNRLKAIGLVFLLGVLLIGSVILSSVLGLAEEQIARVPNGETIRLVVNIAVNLGLSTLIFTLLYRFFPDRHVSWKAALLGGVFAAVAWAIGRSVLGWWLSRDTGATAGTIIGSVLAFLALVYYAWQIILFGAELTASYDEIAHPEWFPGEGIPDIKAAEGYQEPLHSAPLPPFLQEREEKASEDKKKKDD